MISMNPRLCIRCGQAINQPSEARSPNPNLCSFCSNLADDTQNSRAAGLTL